MNEADPWRTPPTRRSSRVRMRKVNSRSSTRTQARVAGEPDHARQALLQRRLRSEVDVAVDHTVEEKIIRLRTEAADPEVNLMPTLMEASRAYATLGEMMGAMADVFGRWEETARI